MPPTFSRTHRKMLQRLMYGLKRQYGAGPLDFYLRLSSATDLKTGLKTIQSKKHSVRRAVVLPATHGRTVVSTISKVSAGKEFIYGGYYDRETRVFLVDVTDCPKDFELTKDDWLVYANTKWQIHQFTRFELDVIHVIHARRTLDEPFCQIFDACAEDSVPLSDSVTEV